MRGKKNNQSKHTHLRPTKQADQNKSNMMFIIIPKRKVLFAKHVD